MHSRHGGVISPHLVIVRCPTERLADIARTGLDVEPADVFPSLRRGAKQPGEALLVAMPPDGVTGDRIHLSADRFLNLSPYLPPRPVAAAGGVLARHVAGRLQVLLIHRRGVWDLPKGKQDRGETISECAVREVNEELGIDDARIVEPLGRTRHGYPEGRHFVLKTTHWYRMRSDARQFRPQASEQIEAVGWFHLDDAIRHLAFEGLRALLRRVSGGIEEDARPAGRLNEGA